MKPAAEQIKHLRRPCYDFVKTGQYIILKDADGETITSLLRNDFEAFLEETGKLNVVVFRHDERYGPTPVNAVPVTFKEYWYQIPPYLICDHLNEFKNIALHTFFGEELGGEFKPWIEDVDFVEAPKD